VIDLSASAIELVLLDIEGTTTPMAFVHEILFPFARRHLDQWLADHWNLPDLSAVVVQLSAEHAAEIKDDTSIPAWPRDVISREYVATYARWLMDRDRKSPGLKALQGLIWDDGYATGALHGVVYPDVPGAIRRWRDRGIRVAIYSSGSELAQRRLFASLSAGDLTPLLDGFFDTAVGAKRDEASYRRITSAMGHAPEHSLFVSDVMTELAAASAAGCRTALSVRPDVPPQPRVSGFEPDIIRSFDEII
jgi:enolase-phosphatase E1